MNTIISFGIYRSGSTLIWNYLKKVFPEYDVHKTHTYWKMDTNIPVVITNRYIYDVMSSLWRVRFHQLRNGKDYELGDKMTWEEFYALYQEVAPLYRLIDKYKKNYKNVMILEYKHFNNQLFQVHDKIESFFNIKISPSQRTLLEDELSIESMKQIQYKYKTFMDYDPETHIHGNHILNDDDFTSKVMPADFPNRIFLQNLTRPRL